MKLKTAPKGYGTTFLPVIGATPVDALSGPMPPGYGVMAMIAAPLVDHGGSLPELAVRMAGEASEHEWRAQLLKAIK